MPAAGSQGAAAEEVTGRAPPPLLCPSDKEVHYQNKSLAGMRPNPARLAMGLDWDACRPAILPRYRIRIGSSSSPPGP